jgi:hypothetical protein
LEQSDEKEVHVSKAAELLKQVLEDEVVPRVLRRDDDVVDELLGTGGRVVDRHGAIVGHDPTRTTMVGIAVRLRLAVLAIIARGNALKCLGGDDCTFADHVWIRLIPRYGVSKSFGRLTDVRK